MTIKNSVLSFLVLSLLINFCSCSKKPEKKPEIKAKTKIGLCLSDIENERNNFIKKCMEESAKSEKINLVVEDAGKDLVKQKKTIEKMIEEKVKVVILQPMDDLIIKDYISMLQEKGIKIILIDVLPKDVSVDAFIACDYLRAGELQGQFITSQKEKVDVLIFRNKKEVIQSIYQGNLNVLKDNKKVTSLEYHEIDTKEMTINQDETKTALEKASADSFIVHNEMTTENLIKILKDKNLLEKNVIATIGLNKNIVKEIKSNENIAAVDTMPRLLAQLAFTAAMDLAEKENWQYDIQINNGKAIVPAKMIPVRLITKENIFLLKERFKEILQEEEKSSKTNEEEKKEEDSKKETKLKIKTSEGKEFEVSIPGDIENVEIKTDKEEE